MRRLLGRGPRAGASAAEKDGGGGEGAMGGRLGGKGTLGNGGANSGGGPLGGGRHHHHRTLGKLRGGCVSFISRHPPSLLLPSPPSRGRPLRRVGTGVPLFEAPLSRPRSA